MASQRNAIDEEMKAPTLSVREKKVRDDFVTEYLKDNNGTKAAIRIGYGPSFAHEMSVRFLQEPYTLQQLEARKAVVVELTDEEIKEAVKARLYRVMKDDNAPYQSIVAAASKLATIFGMDAPIKKELTGANGSPLVPVSLQVYFDDEPDK